MASRIWGCVFFFSSRRRHTRLQGDWSSDVCSSDLTTTAAKLARKLKAEGRPTRLVAADVYRPAAIDQLETLGQQLEIRSEERRVGKECRGACAGEHGRGTKRAQAERER